MPRALRGQGVVIAFGRSGGGARAKLAFASRVALRDIFLGQARLSTPPPDNYCTVPTNEAYNCIYLRRESICRRYHRSLFVIVFTAKSKTTVFLSVCPLSVYTLILFKRVRDSMRLIVARSKNEASKNLCAW